MKSSLYTCIQDIQNGDREQALALYRKQETGREFRDVDKGEARQRGGVFTEPAVRLHPYLFGA